MFRTVELEELGGAGLGGKLLGVGNGLFELGALGSSHDDGFGFGLVREFFFFEIGRFTRKQQ